MPKKRSSRFRKILVALGGGATILVGIVLIPTPAPEGWLILFGGIALLATEYTFAKRWLARAKKIQKSLQAWVADQSHGVRVSFTILATLIIAIILLIVALVIFHIR